VLELGKPGSAGVEKGTSPVLQDGVVVATLRVAGWKEAATAVVGDRPWVLRRQGRELVGRWAEEPEAAVRLRARHTSWWRGSWVLDLEGTEVQMQNASLWRGTHRYLVGGRRIAESGTTGGWSPRPTLVAEPSLAPAHQVFLLWVELVLRRRSTAAATAAATGGAAAAGSS
jgi:hypothetical protein